MNDRLTGGGLTLAVFTALCSGVGITLMKSGFGGGTIDLTVSFLGIVIYGVGIVGGMVMVAEYPISVAYPVVVGLSLVVVGAISAASLGETLTPFKLAGTALIVGGVVILQRPRLSR